MTHFPTKCCIYPLVLLTSQALLFTASRSARLAVHVCIDSQLTLGYGCRQAAGLFNRRVTTVRMVQKWLKDGSPAWCDWRSALAKARAADASASTSKTMSFPAGPPSGC